MTRIFSTAVAVVGLCGLSLAAGAQSPGNVQAAAVTAAAQPGTVTCGSHATLRITVTVAPQFHINAHQPNDPALIATTFNGTGTAGVMFGAAKYPAAKKLKVNYETKPMAVYQGRTVIVVPFSIAKTAKPGRLTLSGTLTYQGCSATACYPPTSTPVQAVVIVR